MSAYQEQSLHSRYAFVNNLASTSVAYCKTTLSNYWNNWVDFVLGMYVVSYFNTNHNWYDYPDLTASYY